MEIPESMMEMGVTIFVAFATTVVSVFLFRLQSKLSRKNELRDMELMAYAELMERLQTDLLELKRISRLDPDPDSTSLFVTLDTDRLTTQRLRMFVTKPNMRKLLTEWEGLVRQIAKTGISNESDRRIVKLQEVMPELEDVLEQMAAEAHRRFEKFHDKNSD